MILGQLCMDAMQLEDIMRVIQPMTVQGSPDVPITGLAYDSRLVKPGYLFVARRGAQQDGSEFVRDAIARGAVAVVAEQDLPECGGAVTLLRVGDAQRALAELACAFYEQPARRLQVLGVTGTNGKTTVAFMTREILRADGRAPGMVGTVHYEIGARQIPATRTTPESVDLQAMLSQMLKAGCRSAVMEVSSHALAQKRVWGLDFDVGIFTNLTPEHLDFHKTMDRYFAAKALLFNQLGQMEKKAAAVINVDDPWGMKLASLGAARVQVITYGLHPAANVRAENVEVDLHGARFDLRTPWGDAPMRLQLLGRHNISNALAACGATGALGVDPRLMARALDGLAGVPGRLEAVPNHRGLHIFVDYAHTPDALQRVLVTLREFAPGQLIVVFGCGGNRDTSKRPVMGAIASQLADYSIITTDNARREDPAAIAAQVELGFGKGRAHAVILDREAAIAQALGMARRGDIVLLAGKGHETVQEIGHAITPFDDREVARRWLNVNP